MRQTITTTLVAFMLSISAFAQISVFPNTTNFESEGLCGTSCAGACNLTGVWRNADQYGFPQAGTDWLSEDGSTPSTDTGPDIDHTSGTASGKYAYVESSGCNSVSAHLVSDIYDFTALTAPKISFWYHMYGATMGTMHVDVDVSGVGTWTTDVVPSWTGNVNAWQLKVVDLSAYAGNASVRIRIRSTTGTSFTSDMAVDDITVFDPLTEDLEHMSVSAGGGCGNTSLTPVEIILVNAGSDTINAGTSIPVSFEIGGVVVTDTIITTIPYLPNDTFAYTFVNGFADLSGAGIVTIDSWVDWDLASGNDSSTVNTQGIPIIGTFPYFEDFEGGQNGWVINNGAVGTWAFGTPAKTTINSAGSGVNSFVTGGLSTGFYNDLDNSYIQGPCFDFTDICDPVISMKVWWNAEFSWDGMNVTYSTDGGTTWSLVGAFGDPFNWYTDNTIVGAPGGDQSGWSGRASTTNGSGGWITARHRIAGAGGNANVKIRVNFGTDGSVTDDGVAFDDVKIYNSMDLGADQLACSPATVALDAYEGNAVATYSWSDGATTATTTAATTGTYVVTMTDGACVVSDSLYVLIADVNATVDLGNDSTVCDDVLALNAGNWPQSTFMWSTGSTNNSITAASTAAYTVAVTNVCGVYNDTINVVMDAAPVVALGSDFTSCDTATLDAGSAFSYVWSNADTTSTTTVYTTGVYAVDATSLYGCTASDTINITISTSPVVALGNDSTWCVQAILDAGNAGSSYLWSTADTTSTTTVATTGAYTVEVTNLDGCSTSDTINVLINQPSTFTQTFSECNGFSISVGASNYNTTGSYFDTLVGANGCDSIVNTVLTIAAPVNVATTLSGFTITATATGVGYQWINCANNNPIAGATSQNYTPAVDGNYAVIITDGPCSDTSACVTILGLGVNETSADWIQVYPNPATESVNVATGSITTERITLTNALGQTVQTIEPKTAITAINLSQLTDGVYFVNVLHNGQVKTYKIVKK